MHVCNDNFLAGMLCKYAWKEKEELLHRTIRQGYVFSLETYLNLFPIENINQQYEYGRSKWTLLIAACFYKHKNIVRMLMRRFKPDVNAVGDIKLDFVNDIICGVSPLWVAAAMGQFEIIKLLVEEGNANVNHLSVTRSSPLRAASYIGNLDIVQYLIAHDADMKLVRDGNYTNLMLCAYRGHTNMVKYFLDELKCDPNESDQDGRTPLHYAIDGCFLDVVQLLLKYGAKNSSSNAESPLVLAALEAREDIVCAFENYCSSDLEWIEAREILGASYANIESKAYNRNKAIEHIRLAYKYRIEKNLPKLFQSVRLIEAYDFSQECQTLEEFNQILSESSTRLHIESLLIQERLLGQKSKRYRRAIKYYGALLADTHRYDISIKFWLYELDLRRKHQISFDKCDLRSFVHIISEMMISNVDTIPEYAILNILRVLNDELSNGRNLDYNLLTLLYLITIISNVSEEQYISSLTINIYRILMALVRNNYTTIEDSHHWTLLHLSMKSGFMFADDNHIMALRKYSWYNTVRLLIQSGANVDTMDSERNTPLHLIAKRTCDIDNTLLIIDLLCNIGGAHPDCANDQGQTPLEVVSSIHIKDHLRQKLGVSRLKCVCARYIRKSNIQFRTYQFPLNLVNFIEMH